MNYFYPNVCHVCKAYGKNVHLITCSGCRMISYCSERHERLHWPEHKEICNAILNVRIPRKRMDTKFISDLWLHRRVVFMDAVTMKLGRRLKIHEEQMFLHPKACDVCHVQYDVNRLFACEHCPGSNLCSKHLTNYKHLTYCRQLNLAFRIERISFDLFTRFANLDYLPSICAENPPLTMNDFIRTHVLPDRCKEMPLDLQEMWAAVHSDYISPPLTLFFAMQTIDYGLTSENLVVHVIGANPMLVKHRQPWEILLHLKPHLKSLFVMMIGMNLGSLSENDLLCSKCQSEEKRLSFQTVSMSYCDYARENSFRRPDLIIGFNIGLRKYPKGTFCTTGTWVDMIKVIVKQNCPYILTSHNVKWLKLEEFILNSSRLRTNLVTRYCGRNQFGGLRPYRGYYDEIVRYCNTYIIIYDKGSESTLTTLVVNINEGSLSSLLDRQHCTLFFNREILSTNIPDFTFRHTQRSQ